MVENAPVHLPAEYKVIKPLQYGIFDNGTLIRYSALQMEQYIFHSKGVMTDEELQKNIMVDIETGNFSGTKPETWVSIEHITYIKCDENGNVIDIFLDGAENLPENSKDLWIKQKKPPKVYLSQQSP